MQPKIPSEVIAAIQRAPGEPLPPGSDPTRPGGLVPPGVMVEEQDWSGDEPFRSKLGSGALRIVVMWKREPWRWKVLGLLCALSVVTLLFMLVTFPWVLKVVVGPIWLLGTLLFLVDNLGRVLNRTTIECSEGTLSVRNGPIPWAGNKRVMVSEIMTLHIEDRAGVRVMAERHRGPDIHLFGGALTHGLTHEQANYVVDRIRPLIPAKQPAARPTEDE